MPSKPPTHRPPGYRSDAERKADYDQYRASASQRGYGTKWRKLRDWFIRHHPLCAECLRQGRTTAGAEVDHITPHKGDQALFWSKANLQTLCKPCHSRKTATEDSAFAGPPRGPSAAPPKGRGE